MNVLTPREAIFQLRQGHLLAVADETGWNVVADPANDATVAQLLALPPAPAEAQPPTVLVPHSGQVALYVQAMPDVAHDLVEFAERPLTVIYDTGKNVAATFPAGPLAVRRALDKDVLFLLGGWGRGLLARPLETATFPTALANVVVGQVGKVPAAIQRPRVLRLGAGGEISFIRK